MEAGEPQPAVLSREAVEADTWHAAHAYWLKRMADEAERKRFETTIRYQTVFSVKRKQAEGRLAKERAGRERPPVFGASSIAAMQRELAAPIAPPPLGAAIHPVPPTTERTPRAHAAPVMPSFLNRPEAPAASMMNAPQAPPVIREVPQAVARPPLVATPQRRPHVTMSMDASELVKAAQAATPFGKTPSEPNMPAVTSPQPAPPRAKQDLGRTMMGESSAATGRATPFAAEGFSKPGNTAPPVSRQPSAAGLPFRDEPSSDGHPLAPPAPPTGTGTAPLPDDARDYARRLLEGRGKPPIAAAPPANLGSTSPVGDVANLPFRGRPASSGAFPAVVQPPPAPPPPPQEDRSEERSPKTQAFDFNSLPAHLREVLPFAMGAQPLPPPPEPPKPLKKRFSINVFASLTAELAETPHDAEAIRSRYGLTEADHHEESRAWTHEFQVNDEIRQRYLGIVQRYRGYIQQRKR